MRRQRERWPTGIPKLCWGEAFTSDGLVTGRILFPPNPSVILLLTLALSLGPAAGAPSVSSPHARAELIADTDSVAPGQESWLGLRFELESGWHIYWINPGDSGEPPRVQWHLPAGFRVGSVDYGYEGEALLMASIQPPSELAVGDSVKFEATVKWLVCRETCIPPQGVLIYDGAHRRQSDHGSRRRCSRQELRFSGSSRSHVGKGGCGCDHASLRLLGEVRPLSPASTAAYL